MECSFAIGNRTLVQALIKALRHQHAKGAWLATYCTSNFLLAEAGLLDSRYATPPGPRPVILPGVTCGYACSSSSRKACFAPGPLRPT
ncbi:hypothetical protein C4K39_2703 [Pseudomonas sessilinigenes]|nr:hypothetical protein C4K39_2703 [Pseudomonas sessilinigenes]